MASNVDLIATAKALAGELEETIVTEGLNNVQLNELVKSLKASKDAKAQAEADAKAQAEADAKASKGDEYLVADGKSVTSLKGIRGPGTPVEAKHFPGGQETLDDLIDRGLVVKS